MRGGSGHVGFQRRRHQGGRTVHTGILHSGSGFGDQQFFELYARVAGVIAGQLEPPA